MFVAFRIRQEEDRTIIAALLGLATRGNQMMYLGLLLLGIGGLGAAASAGLLLAPWVIASYVVVVVTLLAMCGDGLGLLLPAPGWPRRGPRRRPASTTPSCGRRSRGSRRPEALAGVGLTALVLLIWLMTIKPG